MTLNARVVALLNDIGIPEKNHVRWYYEVVNYVMDEYNCSGKTESEVFIEYAMRYIDWFGYPYDDECDAALQHILREYDVNVYAPFVINGILALRAGQSPTLGLCELHKRVLAKTLPLSVGADLNWKRIMDSPEMNNKEKIVKSRVLADEYVTKLRNVENTLKLNGFTLTDGSTLAAIVKYLPKTTADKHKEGWDYLSLIAVYGKGAVQTYMDNQSMYRVDYWRGLEPAVQSALIQQIVYSVYGLVSPKECNPIGYASMVDYALDLANELSVLRTPVIPDVIPALLDILREVDGIAL